MTVMSGGYLAEKLNLTRRPILGTPTFNGMPIVRIPPSDQSSSIDASIIRTSEPARGRACIEHVRECWHVSERRACAAPGQHRSTQCKIPWAENLTSATPPRGASRCSSGTAQRSTITAGEVGQVFGVALDDGDFSLRSSAVGNASIRLISVLSQALPSC